MLTCNSLLFQIHNSSIKLFMYLITSHILQKIFFTLGFELVPQLLSPVSGPVLLLNFLKNYIRFQNPATGLAETTWSTRKRLKVQVRKTLVSIQLSTIATLFINLSSFLLIKIRVGFYNF